MDKNKTDFKSHHFYKYWRTGAPTSKRIVLIFVYIIIAGIFFIRAYQHNWVDGEPLLILFSWDLYLGSLLGIPDLSKDIPLVLSIFYYGLLFILYLSILCLLTTFLIRIRKVPRTAQVSSLLVPLVIHLSGVGFFALSRRGLLSVLAGQQLIGTLTALAVVLSYRILDWVLAKSAVTQRSRPC